MMRLITDKDEINRAELLKRGVVDEPVHFNRDWLIANGWVVAVIQRDLHFERQDLERLFDAFNLMGCRVLIAIATEPLLEDDGPFRLSASIQDLIAFDKKCAMFNFVLLPEDRSAAVLHTVDDYYLIAGPQRFVAQAVGGDISATWAEFREEAKDPVWQGYLEKIVERYAPFSSVVA